MIISGKKAHMFSLRVSIVLLAATGTLAPGCGAAAEADNDLLQAAYDEEAYVVTTLDELVNVESGSMDSKGLDELAIYLANRLDQLNAKVERIRSPSGGADVVKGVFDGPGSLTVMLLAHMDTVYDEGILESEPYHRDGNLLYGPGIADDKGGIAVILHSLGILRTRGWNDYKRITVVFNPDEEIGSPGSGELIAELGAEHDVVLSFEPSPAKAVIGHEGVLLSAAGTSEVRMRVEGRSAHAGAAPEQGRNALLELANRLLQTRGAAENIEGAQLNWTMADAGTARNQIPASAEAIGDLRVTTSEANDEMKAALDEIVRQGAIVPDTTTSISVTPLRPMYVAGEKGQALANLASSIYAELDGRKLLMHPTTNGGTDAGFAGRSGRPAVLEGLGLAGWGYHAANEYIEIDSIVPRLYLASRMLIELGKESD